LFALFFSNEGGVRKFIAAVDEYVHATGMARLLSKADSRQVHVIENSNVGETAVRAVFWHGNEMEAEAIKENAESPQAPEVPTADARRPSA
jgi:hypothetical protein